MIKKLLLVIMLGIVTIVGCSYYLKHQASQPLNLNKPQLLTVARGQFANTILAQLKEQKLLEHILAVKLMLKVSPALASVKTGTYQLTPGMNALDVFALIASGKEKQFAVTLVEGFRWQDWRKQLMAHPNLQVTDEFEHTAAKIAQQTNVESLEGWLLPDTYHFTNQAPADAIVMRAYTRMQQVLADMWLNRQQDLPYETPYEALIMASIIEKETGKPDERVHIGGVFVNRLRLKMRLQTDPTVIYGLGADYDGNIRRKDLKTATAYNTYMIKGLPPTPIAMPSKLALYAALNPAATEDLYFVSKGDGSHYFSATLQEHNQAVRKYQLKK
ncbi:MAG: UPF0755 protein [Paraglaciecola sp.]|jgi:UPF0755 protein